MESPVGHGDELDGPADGPRHGGDGEADGPLPQPQPLGAGEPGEHLHHDHLQHERDGDDDEEHPVLEHPGEHVLLLDLPRVELVEHLAQHEGVEDHGAVALLVGAEDVPPPVLERQQHGDLERRLRGEVAPHGVADERRRAADGRPVHERLGGRVRGERQGAHGVHDQVHPQELHGGERHLARGDRGHEVDDERRHVDGELELDELLDVVVDAAPPPRGRHHRVEVVVEDDDVGALLGHLRALHAHGQPHVRLLERRRVVGAVAGHGHHVPLLLQPLHQRQLVQRQGPRHDADPVHDLQLLLRRHGAELVPLDDDAAGVVAGYDAALLGDHAGREDVVAGDHLDGDARLRASLNGDLDLWPARVFQSDEAQQCETVVVDLRLLSSAVELLVGEGDAPEAADRHVVDHLLKVPPLLHSELARRSVRVHVHRAVRQHHLRGSFPVRDHAAGSVVPDHHAAALLVRVEGLNVQHLAAPLQRVGVHAEVRYGPRQQRLLRRAACDLRRRHVVRLVNASRGVEPSSLAEQADDAPGDRRGTSRLVRADPKLGHLHLVERQRSGLVGADVCDGPIVSHADRRRTSAFSFTILFMEKASVSVTASGRPSGMATTMMVTACWKMTTRELNTASKVTWPLLNSGFPWSSLVLPVKWRAVSMVKTSTATATPILPMLEVRRSRRSWSGVGSAVSLVMLLIISPHKVSVPTAVTSIRP
uniref:Uncharacterized protein n=1 Tax=Triticum urartu TaxID=4572 RepID=A0A8R7K2R3_TRIUA